MVLILPVRSLSLCLFKRGVISIITSKVWSATRICPRFPAIFTEPPAAPRAPQQYGCPLLWVCVHGVCVCVCVCVCVVHYSLLCVCALGWVKCRAHIPSMGHTSRPFLFLFLNKLQVVQNAAVRVLTRSRKYDHITLILRSLHWLPIKFHISYKILLLAYKALNGLAPVYLTSPISCYNPSRSLRSQNSGLLVPRIAKSTK